MPGRLDSDLSNADPSSSIVRRGSAANHCILYCITVFSASVVGDSRGSESVRSDATCPARAGKVGDKNEARLGSVLFILSGFNFLQLLFVFSDTAGRQSCLHIMVSNAASCFSVTFAHWFKNHPTKIVYSPTCHATPYARIERSQDESSGRHSRSAE